MDKAYHLGCGRGEVHKDAILFGDPDRCEIVKKLIDKYELVSARRGFVLYNGTNKGNSFTFGALGIGGPSWSIGLHELAESGTERFLRVGTSGIINPNVKAGDIIIPNFVVSDEGASGYIINRRFKLKPDEELQRRAIKSAQKLGYNFHVGMIHSKDFLYMEDPKGYPLEEKHKQRMKGLKDLGILVTEMECAALFAFGRARNYKTAAILAAIDEDSALSNKTQVKAVKVALEVLNGGKNE
jgi:uridine phosphorylase